MSYEEDKFECQIDNYILDFNCILLKALIVLKYFVNTIFFHISLHLLCCQSSDRSVDSSKTNSPQSVVLCFFFQFTLHVSP
jgi:hypothetical protein